MKYRFHIADVFTTSAFGGNQLAVLPNAAGLSDQGMQHIAREFNFTETTFVLPPQTKANTYRVRIFTPRAEVQFAGHPIVGTACALVEGGYFGRRDAPRTDLILEEGVGPISAVVKPIGELLEATFTLHGKLEQADVPASKADMARVLGIRSEGVLDVSSGSFGLPFTFAQLSSAEEVDRAALDHAAWSQHVAGSRAPQVFLFAQDPGNSSSIYARMFAPALGVPEDPATGSACAALAGIRACRGRSSETASLTALQGVSMGRRSEIHASATQLCPGVTSVSVGGTCVAVASGELEVPTQWLV
jgi:trans-2,3-dihydro-3-hydroxyanthranilate isomerase